MRAGPEGDRQRKFSWLLCACMVSTLSSHQTYQKMHSLNAACGTPEIRHLRDFHSCALSQGYCVADACLHLR